MDLKTRRKRKAGKSKKSSAKKAKKARISKKGDSSEITSDGGSNPPHSDTEESPTDDEDSDDSNDSDLSNDESGDIEGELQALRTRSGRSSKTSMDPSRWKKTQPPASAISGNDVTICINTSTANSTMSADATPPAGRSKSSQAEAPDPLDAGDAYSPPPQGGTAHPSDTSQSNGVPFPSGSEASRSPCVSQLAAASSIKTDTDPSWPEWFRDGYDLLAAKDLGAAFTTALNTYVQLESRTSFEAGTRSEGFKPANRPTEVAWWVARGRKSQPKIVDTRAFEQHWWKWWKGLQPVWREVAGVEGALNPSHRMCSRGDGGWTTMNKHGRNAFLTVMATLVWWAEGLKDHAQDPGWVAAVEEVGWVLDQVVSRSVSLRELHTAGAHTQCSQSATTN